jgi:hypothetical protein
MSDAPTNPAPRDFVYKSASPPSGGPVKFSALGDLAPRSSCRHFSVLGGPHPPSRSLGALAPRSGRRRFRCFTALLAASLILVIPSAASAQARRPDAAASELDAFMEKVLARREVNRQTLKQYILDESEEFEILGPGRWPLHRNRREYTWYVRDGVHVRSPIRFDGVKVEEDARARYEREWLSRERRRQEDRARREKEKAQDKENPNEKGESSVSVGPQGVEVASPGIPAEPRFVSEAYFMDFKFEPGNYYLAGREKLEGKEVLKIEYYPTRMFGDNDKRDGDTRNRDKQKREQEAPAPKMEQDIERRMNKTALITLWVDPSEHQIVKYTFDNVWLDFLPGAWLVRVDEMRASMTMGQPFAGVWLPRGLNIHAGITLANGSYEASYARAFAQYREADVKSRIRTPRVGNGSDDRKDRNNQPVQNDHKDRRVQQVQNGRRGWQVQNDWRVQRVQPVHHRMVQNIRLVRNVSYVRAGSSVEDDRQTETIGEIRVHGNAFLSDEAVIGLAGIAVGQPLTAEGIDGITEKLKDSGRFESVEVRKRYRSLTDSSDVAVILLVHEKPEVRAENDGPGAVFNPIRRMRSRLMFLPIVSYADGYGFTYGGRVSTVDLLGVGERLSVPLTWGGVRRAALEFERQFDNERPLTRIETSLAIWNRENPRFNIRDERVELKGRAEKVLGDIVRLGVDGSRSTISFADINDRLTTIGANVALDTRGDPAFPGNAVLLSAGWTGLNFRSIPERVNRYAAEARGYLRVYRQAVVAARAQYVTADATLPAYERLLLGGSSTIRGFRTGSFDGDRLLATSAELRVPVTSVLNGAKLGFTAFIDAGRVWNADQAFDAVPWRKGVGAGVFLIAPLVRINLDVAQGLRTGDTRVHLSSGFSF